MARSIHEAALRGAMYPYTQAIQEFPRGVNEEVCLRMQFSGSLCVDQEYTNDSHMYTQAVSLGIA